MHRFPQADPEGIHIKNWSNYGAGETAPFQSLTEEEVMAQMKQGPSLREGLVNIAVVLVVAIVVSALLLFLATLAHFALWLMETGWNVIG